MKKLKYYNMSKIFKKSPDKNYKVSTYCRATSIVFCFYYKVSTKAFYFFMFQTIGNQKNYLSRITKTLYYGKLPKTDTLSLPVTGG